MKKYKLLAILLLFIAPVNLLKAQVPQARTFEPGLQLTPKVGYDIVPLYNNNTPYIDYKGGLYAGISASYYWNKFGIGVDFDYIQNKPKSNLPVAGLTDATGTALTSFSLTEKSIARTFIGFGPGYRLRTGSGKFIAELNTRAGIGFVNGGRTELRETTTGGNTLLNFHAGYKTSVLSTKAEIKGTYFIRNNIGISAGVYYLNHFNTPELTDPLLGFSAFYQPIKATVAGHTFDGGFKQRTNPCNCNVSSIGAFAGVTIKLTKRKKPEDCKPEYSLVVTAKDKYTGEVLPGTEVKTFNKDGSVALSGITNAYGVVVFENLKPFDYEITGSLNTVSLEGNKATNAEFMKHKTVQKTILYGDRNFIIKGKIFECNSSKTIGGVSVILENVEQAYQKTTLSAPDGSFMIQLPQAGTYSLYGKKNNYLSQAEEVNASNYNRDKNLFVQLEICAEQAECGKAIQLKNILFDLDKYVIKDAAKKELNRLVQFMKDNPSVKVELSSHTDCRASHEYNETLSQNRANASVDYIVSKGISRDRLVGKGYGETKLLNKCADGVSCTEAEHAINRRTEMKVICPGK